MSFQCRLSKISKISNEPFLSSTSVGHLIKSHTGIRMQVTPTTTSIMDIVRKIGKKSVMNLGRRHKNQDVKPDSATPKLRHDNMTYIVIRAMK